MKIFGFIMIGIGIAILLPMLSFLATAAGIGFLCYMAWEALKLEKEIQDELDN